MTTDNFCFYFQNRLIQTSQTGGQPYSDSSPFSIPWLGHRELLHSGRPQLKTLAGDKRSSLFFRIMMAMKEKFDPLDNRFVLPIGATVNMNGSALYEAVAPIFIAQVCSFRELGS